MNEQIDFVSRDATTLKPHKVTVGDYFVREDVKYTIIGIDANILAFVFTGCDLSIPTGKYAQFITSRAGHIRRFEPLTIERETTP